MDRKNWAMKFDSDSDERYEKEERAKLEKALEELDILENSTQQIDKRQLLEALKKIVDRYENMRRQVFEYDEEDYKRMLDRFNRLKYEIGKEEHESEDRSWGEYRDEEER